MFRAPHSRRALSQRVHAPKRHTKYIGSVKPEDWLVDYSTAANIANGNKCVAVKYVPLMLQGTA